MRRPCIIAATLLFIAGCGSSSTTVVETVLPEDPGPVIHSDYETFDASAYPDAPVGGDIEFSHDVPQTLMQNRADAGVEQTVSGYRVQIMATLDPAEAQLAEEELAIWWTDLSEDLPTESVLAAGVEIYTRFRQPYYRIRMGDLTRRADAEELRILLSGQYPGAFIVPDQVTVRK